VSTVNKTDVSMQAVGCVSTAERLKMSGTKYDGDKLRMDLIPPEVMTAIAEVLTMGAVKYDDHNWREGIQYSRVVGALKRHLTAWEGGEVYDSESKLNHMAHVLCNAAFLITYEFEGRSELNDLYAYNQGESNAS